MKGLAEIVAISTDGAEESFKMSHLLEKTFPLLSDPDLKVISAYQMRHQMGSMTVGNMGYAIIDRQGQVRTVEEDGAFGRHADTIIQSLKVLP